MTTAGTDLDRCNIQFEPLQGTQDEFRDQLAPRRVSGGDDDNYHGYRTRLFYSTNERNRIR